MKKKLFKSWHSIVAAVVIVAAAIALIVGIVRFVLTIVEVRDTTDTTPEEAYVIIRDVLEGTFDQTDSYFLINYVKPGEYRDHIWVSGSRTLVERSYRIPERDAVEYYENGKIALHDLETGEKTIRDGEYRYTAEELRKERNLILERIYSLMESDIDRTVSRREETFEGHYLLRTVTIDFDRQQMDEAGFFDWENTVVFDTYYYTGWEVGITERGTGTEIWLGLPEKGEYKGDFVVPQMPESYDDYTVIE